MTCSALGLVQPEHSAGLPVWSRALRLYSRPACLALETDSSSPGRGWDYISAQPFSLLSLPISQAHAPPAFTPAPEAREGQHHPGPQLTPMQPLSLCLSHPHLPNPSLVIFLLATFFKMWGFLWPVHLFSASAPESRQGQRVGGLRNAGWPLGDKEALSQETPALERKQSCYLQSHTPRP